MPYIRRMLPALDPLRSCPCVSFPDLFLPSYIRLLHSSDSKKMTAHKTPDAFNARPDSFPGSQSASLGRVGRSSSPNRSHRSRSPQAVRQQSQTSPKRWTEGTSSESGAGSELNECPFDICRPTATGLVKLKKPLLFVNRERKKELECAQAATGVQCLRSGMVLLANFISHVDQVKIVNKCRELGLGCGGFYRPGYSDGAKLRLQMMCLGKDWNPELRLYEESRSLDDAAPPEIPQEFRTLVTRALYASNNFLRQRGKSGEELPWMSPDICIVNFYNSCGRLGLHQDRDESTESLEKGIPVVSFSIGDTAEFLYGDVRDVDTAKKVMLKSGDVLIFGGKSRHIFHGVPCIKPNTAPLLLTDETNLRPGRLNLTFRQY